MQRDGGRTWRIAIFEIEFLVGRTHSCGNGNGGDEAGAAARKALTRVNMSACRGCRVGRSDVPCRVMSRRGSLLFTKRRGIF